MIYTLEAGDGGLATDLDGMDASDMLWTTGQNVRFENGYFKPFEGHSAIYDPPSVVPYGAFPMRLPSSNVWVYLGLAKAYTVSNTSVHTDITRAAGDYTANADTKWTGGVLTSYLIFNNQNDAAQSWNGDTGADAILLANWDATWRCAAIRPLRNYIVAVNITKGSSLYPVMVKWSHAADPGALPNSWDAADATKDAGEQDISDCNGSLVDIVPFGDLGIIYATDSYHAMQYIGGTYVWRFSKLFGSAGAISQNCAVEYPGGHVVLTSGDVISHAGGQPTSIINARMRSNLFASIDQTNYRRSFVVHNELRSEVWICVPEGSQTSCTKAYVWNYAANTWSIRDLPNVTSGNSGPVITATTDTWADADGTWADDTGTWGDTTLGGAKRKLVMTSTATKLYLMDDGINFAGASAPMSLERSGLALGDTNKIKMITSIRPEMDAPVGTAVNFRVGTSLYADGPITWSSPYTYTVGSSRAAFFLQSGRYVGVRMESTAGATWRCRKTGIEFEVVGER